MPHTYMLASVLFAALVRSTSSYALGSPSFAPTVSRSSVSMAEAADLNALGVTGLPIEKTVRGFRARRPLNSLFSLCKR